MTLTRMFDITINSTSETKNSWDHWNEKFLGSTCGQIAKNKFFRGVTKFSPCRLSRFFKVLFCLRCLSLSKRYTLYTCQKKGLAEDWFPLQTFQSLINIRTSNWITVYYSIFLHAHHRKNFHPRCSMYGIFSYIYHEHCQMWVNIPYMDPMGYIFHLCRMISRLFFFRQFWSTFGWSFTGDSCLPQEFSLVRKHVLYLVTSHFWIVIVRMEEVVHLIIFQHDSTCINMFFVNSIAIASFSDEDSCFFSFPVFELFSSFFHQLGVSFIHHHFHLWDHSNSSMYVCHSDVILLAISKEHGWCWMISWLY